ncbi:MAG: epimerase [Microcella sp.]
MTHSSGLGRGVVAGASGFVGRELVESYRQQGRDVTLIGRSGPVPWNDPAAIATAVDGAAVLVNLAGRSVNCRYGPANREEILRSRVDTTRALSEAVARADQPPALWINASTATIYRHAMDRPQTESTGELGTGFSVSIARAWEDAFFAGELPNTRRVALRMAIVLGDGSALRPLAMLTRVGLGGAQHDGRWPITRARRAAGTAHEQGSSGGDQRFSWVHLDDVVRVHHWLESTPEVDGPLNVASPRPETNRELMAHLRRILRRPFGMPMRRWMLELGSFVIRTETELVLKSRWVVPERLEAAGFTFEHPDLDEALASILNRA